MVPAKEDPQGANQLEGRYANYFKIGHNAFEFLIDFGQLYNGELETPPPTRIITSPFYARELLEMLREAVEQHEQKFGALQKE